jgi:hypothetical protein
MGVVGVGVKGGKEVMDGQSSDDRSTRI